MWIVFIIRKVLLFGFAFVLDYFKQNTLLKMNPHPQTTEQKCGYLRK